MNHLITIRLDETIFMGIKSCRFHAPFFFNSWLTFFGAKTIIN